VTDHRELALIRCSQCQPDNIQLFQEILCVPPAWRDGFEQELVGHWDLLTHAVRTGYFVGRIRGWLEGATALAAFLWWVANL
jgi:hypothetical protein